MKTVEAFVELVDVSGAPQRDVTVAIEHFALGKGSWVELTRATSNAEGKAKLRAAFVASDTASAPGFRLVRADTTPVAVLSEGGRTVYAAGTGVLSIEFGSVETIDTELSAPPPLAPRFRGAEQAIGGVARAGVTDRVGRINLGGAVFRAPISVGTPRARVEADQLRAENSAATIEAAKRNSDLAVERSRVLSERLRADTAERLVQEAASPTPQIKELQLQFTRFSQLNEEITGKLQAAERERSVAVAERDAAARQAEAMTLRAQVFEAEKQQVVPIATLAENVRAQIETARAATGATGLKIGAVRIRVRGKLGEGGAGITLPGNDVVQENAGGTLDEVSFDIDPAAEAASTQTQVPDVIGLTETAARQVLASLGFRIDVVSGGPAAGPIRTGQAMRQAPGAGQQTGRGSTVLVVFAG